MDDIDVKPEITENLLLASSSSKEGFGAGFDDALFVVKEEIIEDSALECDQEEQDDDNFPLLKSPVTREEVMQLDVTENQEMLDTKYMVIKNEVPEELKDECSGNFKVESSLERLEEEDENQNREESEHLEPEFVDVMCSKVECSDILMEAHSSSLKGKNKKGTRRQDPLHTVKKPCSKSRYLKCVHCGKIFVNKPNLVTHILGHYGIYKFHCKVCEKNFDSKSAFYRHHRSFHVREKPFECNLCDLHFSLEPQLASHKQLAHFQMKTFHCDRCGESFALKEFLETHKIVESGVKPYVCKDCGDGFEDDSMLTKHLMGHLKIKSFHCDQCDQSFTQEEHFLDHKSTHSSFSVQVNKSTSKKPLKKSSHGKLSEPYRKFSLDHNANMRVSGVPKSRRENEHKLLQDLGQAIGIEVDFGTVVTVHRVPKLDEAPDIVVRFINQEVRDFWLQKFRDKEILVASDIDRDGLHKWPNSRIYMEEIRICTRS